MTNPDPTADKPKLGNSTLKPVSKPVLRINLSLWRFVIFLQFARTLLWTKNEDVYWFHIGTFSKGEDTALKIIILPIALMIGFARKKK